MNPDRNAFDYSEYDSGDAQESTTSDSQENAALTKSVEALELLDKQIAKTELTAKYLADRRRTLVEKVIPNELQKLGCLEFHTSGGNKVVVHNEVYARIPEGDENAISALNWLEENGQGQIITKQYIVNFAKSDIEAAKKFEKLAEENNIPITKKNTVHHKTLEALMKDLLKNGVDVPLKLFGGYIRTVAKVSKIRR